MAQFYATLRGQSRTSASRIGSKSSGITTTTMSWGGSVTVTMWYDDEQDCDMCCVIGEDHPASRDRTTNTLYYGPTSGLKEKN